MRISNVNIQKARSTNVRIPATRGTYFTPWPARPGPAGLAGWHPGFLYIWSSSKRAICPERPSQAKPKLHFQVSGRSPLILDRYFLDWIFAICQLYNILYSLVIFVIFGELKFSLINKGELWYSLCFLIATVWIFADPISIFYLLKVIQVPYFQYFGLAQFQPHLRFFI
jgi:hypothetical protein